MRQSVVNQGNANQALLGGFDPLLNRHGHFARFPGAETDVAGFVPHDHQRGKGQILAALDHLRDAINRNDLILQIQSLW